MENALDIFIVQSSRSDADAAETLKSLCGIFSNLTAHVVENLDEIASTTIRADWFGVLYNNERLDPILAMSLPAHMAAEFDVIKCMKLTNIKPVAVSEAPRFYRKGIRLAKGSLLPENVGSLAIDRALDGWILEHDFAERQIRKQ